MSSMTPETLIPIGFTIMSARYLTLATQVLYYYDYFLTLPDEVKYAWAGRKTWIFFLFLLNRYFPAIYQIWMFFVNFLPQFTHRTCDETVFLEILSFFLCTLLAQVSLILRLYALTRKSKRVTVFFCTISFAQFLVGMYMVGITARKPAEKMPDIPLDAYNLCVFDRSSRLELVYVSLSTFFDVMTFSVIVYVSLGVGLSLHGGQPSILRTIVQHATIYFFCIFVINLGSLVDLKLKAPPTQIRPPFGTFEIVRSRSRGFGTSFMPLMISRMMLSLKKASGVKESGWTTDALSGTYARALTPLNFGRPSIDPRESDGTISSEEVAFSGLGGGPRVKWGRGDRGAV